MKNIAVLASVAVFISTTAIGQALPRDLESRRPAVESGSVQSADFAKAMHAGMQTMEKNMKRAPMTGDADRDFAQMMIPHHQGAIDMAKALLKSGDDPVILEMARNVIEDQQREIKELTKWLEGHSKKTAH